MKKLTPVHFLIGASVVLFIKYVVRKVQKQVLVFYSS